MNNALVFLRALSQRSLGLYLFLVLISFLIVDYQKLRLRTLNLFMPLSYDYLINFAGGKEAADPYRLKEYLSYYETVAKLIAKRSDAYGLSGYFYYHLGKTRKAIASYEKAIRIHPKFFWYPYNLGLIYYKNGQYAQAIESFQQAREASLDATLQFISSSEKIYQPIVVSRKIHFNLDPRKQLKEGFAKTYYLTVLCHYHLKNYHDMLREVKSALDQGLPHPEVFHFYAGLVYYHQKNYGQSVYYFQEVVRRNAVWPEALQYLGESLKALGKEDLAQVFLKKAGLLKGVEFNHPFSEKGIKLEPY